MSYLLPHNELQRLESLELLKIFDTEAEEDFDDLTRLAAHICEVPISVISLVGADRQWFKSKIGLDATETPREVAFCAHTILKDDLFIVPNAAEDERFAASPLVTGDPNIRFYAGAPLITEDGDALGSLCVLDTIPRELRPEQKEALGALARQTVRLLKIRKESAALARANQEIKAREENYRIVSESASDAIITIDEESTIVFANVAVERIFGYSPLELLGSKLSRIVPERMQAAHSAGIKHYMESGRKNIPWSGITVPARRGDGREIQIEMSFGEYSQDGKRRFTAVMRDITERQVIEQRLRDSEGRYRFLAEAVPQQVWTARPDGSLDFVNERVFEYFGLPADTTLPGNNWIHAVDAEDAVEFAARWRDSLQTGQPYEAEFRLRRSDGEYRWHLAQAVAMRDENGTIMRWLGTTTDIHARRQAEKAASESAEYRNLFRNANDAILIFELESEIVIDVNEQACRMYGIERADFIGRSIKTMPQDVTRGEIQLRQLFEKGTHQSFETVQLHADGTPIHLSINSSIIDYQGKRVVLSINHNISERKQAEKMIFESEERLRQSQKMEAIGTLTGGVAHDFNNLLTAILGNTQLALRKIAVDDPLRDRLTEIENAGNRAAVLTRQLLAFSRRQPLNRRTINS